MRMRRGGVRVSKCDCFSLRLAPHVCGFVNTMLENLSVHCSKGSVVAAAFVWGHPGMYQYHHWYKMNALQGSLAAAFTAWLGIDI